MKRITAAQAFAGALFLATVAAPAMAAPVPDCSNSAFDLSSAQITSLLSPAGSFAAAARFADDAVDNNHEALVGANQVWDFKLGTPADPSSQVGTYVITTGTVSSQTVGVIQYTYGGTTFSYFVSVADSSTAPGNTGTYWFCGGTTLNTSTLHSVNVHNAPGP